MVLKIVTDLDLSFVELRALLDKLIADDAFNPSHEEDLGPGKLLDVEVAGMKYVLDVYMRDVVIYRKEPAGSAPALEGRRPR